MTANQIKYAEYLENKRHNVESEKFTSREVATQEMNAATNKLNYEESARHNVTSEGLTSQANRENIRHNKAQEQISYGNLLESQRHNLSSEELVAGQLQEAVRHNLVYEGQEDERIRQDDKRINQQQQLISETVRHNIASENVSTMQARAAQTSAGASVISAQAAQTNANTRMGELDLAKDVERRQIKQQVINEYQKQEEIDVSRQKVKADFISSGFGSLIRFGSSFIR